MLALFPFNPKSVSRMQFDSDCQYDYKILTRKFTKEFPDTKIGNKVMVMDFKSIPY